MNLVSVCQKNSTFSVKNLEARQAKRVISREAAHVEAPMSRHYQQAGPAGPECLKSKNNKGEPGQTYENQQDSNRIHGSYPFGRILLSVKGKSKPD
jgi:hypothetical protein